MVFDRTSSPKLLEKLQDEDLYKKFLKKDNEVFMALRKNEIDFYYKGARIYAYKLRKGFLSDKKYCFNTHTTKSEIYLQDLNKLSVETNMIKNHKFIKANGKQYSGVEALGVSYLYKQDYKSSKRYILLDVEIALSDENKNDRIDILLYDTIKGELKFVEAKHFSNGDLWSKEGSKPEVVSQINRYNKKIEKYYDQILKEYQKYVDILNSTFNLNIKIPKSINKEVSLYMFGFDDNQKEKIKTTLESDGSLDGVRHYFRGDPSKIDIKTLFTKA